METADKVRLVNPAFCWIPTFIIRGLSFPRDTLLEERFPGVMQKLFGFKIGNPFNQNAIRAFLEGAKEGGEARGVKDSLDSQVGGTSFV